MLSHFNTSAIDFSPMVLNWGWFNKTLGGFIDHKFFTLKHITSEMKND